MRPRTLDEYIGQDHIVGKGRLLRRAIAADQLTSVIFYGPPGTGKTTLARVIANHTKSNFITLNAVLTGVADIRNAISQAEEQKKLYQKKTILFVDEVHRWNKSQQDALLPWVENGTIILIGATTENPFFEVNKALVSRSRVFQLKALTKADLTKAALMAINDKERGYGKWKVVFEEGALEHLVETANGDARSLLNALELAVETTPPQWAPDAIPSQPAFGSQIYISKETAEESIQKKAVLYDRDGDYHYDIISAFIKSLRGRDPDAAVYWLARMVKAGEDPDFIFRRMLISACEDTGLADPNAITIVQNCAAAFDRVGMPEGRFFLTHAALYLATAPKSNSSLAFFDALESVEKEDADVPNHLKDSSRDAQGFGHGAGYLYPHAYRDHWVAQQYLPDTLKGRIFYTPSTQGYENIIREDVLSRREIQIAAMQEEENDSSLKWWQDIHFKNQRPCQEENLTYSPEDKNKSALLDKAERSWQKRLDTNKTQVLLSIRNKMLELSKPLRHTRSAVFNADDALLIFEILRKSPEGITCGICRKNQGIELLNQYTKTLSTLDKPQLGLFNENICQSLKQFSDIQFDRLYLRDIFLSQIDVDTFASQIAEAKKENIFSSNALIIISQKIPKGGQKISSMLLNQLEEKLNGDDTKLLEKMFNAENTFFNDNKNPLFSFDENTIASSFNAQNLNTKIALDSLCESRHLTDKEIEAWFDTQKSSYAKSLLEGLTIEEIEHIKNILERSAKKQYFSWTSSNIFIVVEI